MNHARARFSSIVHNNEEIFVFPDGGGLTNAPSTDTIEVYDIALDTWTVLQDATGVMGWSVTAVAMGSVALVSALDGIYTLDMETRQLSGPMFVNAPGK